MTNSRGELKRRVLEAICGIALLPLDLFITIATSDYGASRKQLERRLSEVQDKRSAMFSGNLRVKKKHFDTLIYKLKRDGLILQKGEKLMTTASGKANIKKLAKKLPSPKVYEKSAGEELLIVMFDIPEKQKNKRQWIRSALKEMGFKMIQKSVWSGKVSLSRRFLEDLSKLNLVDYVDIFTAMKLGSLEDS